MANFANSKTTGINQYAKHAGDYPLRHFGLGVLGSMEPARANTYYDYDLEEDVEGHLPCLTEVIEWPWSTDEDGNTFNQSELYGVRTRCWRQTLADGGGDKDDQWIAVPRSLAGAYTKTGRCGILVPLISDYLGENPLETPVSWSLRQPNKIIPDITTAEGIARSLWTPQNFARQVFSSVALPGSDYDEEGPYAGKTWALLASGRTGFRGGKMLFSVPISYWGEATVTIWEKPYDEEWDPWDDGESSPTQIASYDFSWDDDEYGLEIETNVGELLASTTGKVSNFWAAGTLTVAVRDEHGEETGDEVTYGAVLWDEFRLAPRVDVPLWYFSSMGNRCAPGGIIVPSGGW